MVTPLYDNVLIKKKEKSDELQESSGGILIPGNAMKEQFGRGVVQSVGCGYLRGGELIELQVQPGDNVLFRLGSELEVTIEGVKHYVVSEGAMLGIDDEE
jgi:co-chaperonin GroES (HSP10)